VRREARAAVHLNSMPRSPGNEPGRICLLSSGVIVSFVSGARGSVSESCDTEAVAAVLIFERTQRLVARVAVT
jgi:hypothetical protein